MYIRVAQVTVDPGRLDDLIAYTRAQGLPVMRDLPGVQSVTWGVDRATGHATVVSTWDTLEHASFVNSPDFVAGLRALGAQGQGSVYEVTDQI
jgi:hypothetical protein